ncbi:MAG: aminoacyl-tRNA hydrolase, partial [Planctomycetes bacterium]|nr:aminoacyl-tRNA hydrolase [Planctomycetota bacterium]
AEVAEAWCGGEKVYLLKPKTYMNLSGQALAAWLGRFRELRDDIQTPPPEPPPRREHSFPGSDRAKGKKEADEPCLWPGMLVAVDDVNLPLGRMRFRPSGSAGGHNGLKDLEKALGGRGYPRLRLGVGAPPEHLDRVDYVLGRFSSEEMEEVEKMLDTAASAVEEWIRLGIGEVMNKYNGLPRKAGSGADESASEP